MRSSCLHRSLAQTSVRKQFGAPSTGDMHRRAIRQVADRQTSAFANSTMRVRKLNTSMQPEITVTKSDEISQQDLLGELSTRANGESRESTILVDSLMQRTIDMMAFKGTNLLSFSGGVDSSLVAALLQLCHTQQPHSALRKVNAVLGVSPAVSPDQIDMARRVADHVGIELVEVETTEQTDPTYIKNEGQSCWACKTHLYTALQAVSRHAQEQHAKRHMSTTYNSVSFCDMGEVASTFSFPAKDLVLFNGTNLDDTHDATRVGLVAAREFQVRSPLDRITKEQVRQASKHLGLPNWNTAASPCLRSRLAFGVKATENHLSMVHKAERRVKKFLNTLLDGIREYREESTNLRFRLLAGNRAAIELDNSLLQLIPAHTRNDNIPRSSSPTVHELLETSSELAAFFKGELNLSDVYIRPFKSGSVAPKTAATKISVIK